jgi:hypothetical protein
MIAEKDLSEYKALCAALRELRSRFLERKQELKKLLEETAGCRKDALELLAKANGPTRHLTGRQRQMAGLSYHLGEIKAKLKLARSFQSAQSNIHPSIPDHLQWSDDFRTSLELRRNWLAVISMIDQVKKSFLQLDILEMRCRELMASLNKSLEAFRHESRRIHKSLYPLGFISIFFRFLRRLAGKNYFTFRDLDGIADLGNITGLVLRIADSPMI